VIKSFTYISYHDAGGGIPSSQSAFEEVRIRFANDFGRSSCGKLQTLDKASRTQGQAFGSFVVFTLMNCHQFVILILQQNTIGKIIVWLSYDYILYNDAHLKASFSFS